jgi:hypothetical protein
MVPLEKYTYSTNHSLFYRILLCYRQKNILAPLFVAYTIVFSIFFKKKLIYGLPPTSDEEITIAFFYSNVRKNSTVRRLLYLGKILLSSSTVPENWKYKVVPPIHLYYLLRGKNTTIFFNGIFVKIYILHQQQTILLPSQKNNRLPPISYGRKSIAFFYSNVRNTHEKGTIRHLFIQENITTFFYDASETI